MTCKIVCKPQARKTAKPLICGCSSMVEQQLPKRTLLAELRHLFANRARSGGNAGKGLATIDKPEGALK